MSRIFFFCCLFSCSFSFSGPIEKAFESLNRKDYYTADQLFRKSLKKNSSICAFGLTQLYLKHDYLLLDSAYRYVLISEASFSQVKAKSLKKFKEFGFDSLAIQSCKQMVSDAYFEQSIKQSNEEKFQSFIDFNPWSRHISNAIFLRDSVAFNQVKDQNNSAVTIKFLEKYPNSIYYNQGRSLLLDQQYYEETNHGLINDFIVFMNKFPENPHVIDAENRIFELSTLIKGVKEYETFIRRFPKNRNINEAWKMLYRIYMKDFDVARFEAFEKEFPDFPFKEELENERNLFLENYFPITLGEKIGYMNSQGKITIAPEYGDAGPFIEGLAVVLKGEKYGVINKKNETVIDFIYDEISTFNNGRAIAIRGEEYRLIDRSGRFISNNVFKDLSRHNSNYFIGLVDSLYCIYDINLNEVSVNKYNEVGRFIDGFSIVQKDRKFGLIDHLTFEVIPPQFDEIQKLDSDLYVYSINGKKGIVNSKGNKITAPIFDDISGFDQVNKIVVVKNGGNLSWIKSDGTKFFDTNFEYFPNAISLAQFSNDYAIIRKSGKYGLIDNKGNIAFKPSLDILGKYVGAIPTVKSNKWGLIDLKSKVVLPFEYELIESWSTFGILIQKNGLIGLMDYKLNKILPLEFNSIKLFEEQFFLVSKAGKFGLFDFNGKEVVPIIYDRIQLFEKDCLTLFVDNQMEYYFPKTKIHLKKAQ
jgi:outer membrane protein assembly factor BamD (BamD/ComL family)